MAKSTCRVSTGLAVALALAPVHLNATTVATWIGGNGDYTDATNWDTSPLIPNNGADSFNVVIDGNVTVTLDGVNSITVDSLDLGERTRFFVDGILASFVAAGGAFTSGATVRAQNAANVDLGNTVIDASSLSATDTGGAANATITSNATSYTGSVGFNRDRELTADGDGTRLDLASLTTIVRNSGGSNDLNIRARDGGTVDLSSLTSIVAPGAGLSNSVLLIEARSGGTLLLPGITDFDEINYTATGGGNVTGQVHTVTNGRLTIGGASDALTDLSNLTSVLNTVVTAEDGAAVDLGSANVDEASLIAQKESIGAASGATIETAVTSYTGTDGFNRDRTLEADGAGTLLDLGSLTALVRNRGGSNDLNIRALNGGTVDLSGLSTFTDAPGGNGGSTLLVRAASGGTIVLDGITDFDDVRYEAVGGGNVTGAIHSFVNGRLTIGGASDALTDLSNLTTVTDTRVTAQDGALVDLNGADIDRASLIAEKESNPAAPNARLTSAATSYTGTDGFNLDRSFEADGAGTVLDLSALTSLVRNRGGANNLAIRADNGGTIDLSGLSTFTDAPGGNAGATLLVHAGSGGTVELAGITDFDDVQYEAVGGGNITGQIATFVNGRLTIGGASDATTDLTVLTTVNDTLVEAEDGAQVELGDADIDRASLVAVKESNSAQPNATLTSLRTSYTGTDGFALNRELTANGAGTRLDLSALTSFVRNRGPLNTLQVRALNGGVVDLSGLAALSDAAGGNDGGMLELIADDAGEIRLAGVVEFDDVIYTALDGGTITGQMQTFLNGRLTIGGTSDATTDLSALATADGSTVRVQGGAQVDLGATAVDRTSLVARIGTVGGATGARLVSDAVAYTGTDGFNADREFRADGAATVLDLSALVTIVRNRGGLNELQFKALKGGVVDLSALAVLTDPAGGLAGSRILVDAEDAGSHVALGALTALAHAEVTIDRGATVDLASLERFAAGTFAMDTSTSAADQHVADTFVLGSGGVIDVADSPAAFVVGSAGGPVSPGAVNVDGGTFGGSGTVLGDVINAGTTAPGESPGVLTIAGDYTQSAGAILQIEIASASEFDQPRRWRHGDAGRHARRDVPERFRSRHDGVLRPHCGQRPFRRVRRCRVQWRRRRRDLRRGLRAAEHRRHSRTACRVAARERPRRAPSAAPVFAKSPFRVTGHRRPDSGDPVPSNRGGRSGSRRHGPSSGPGVSRV